MKKEKTFDKKNIIVTGAAGQLGETIVNQILKSGGNVIAIDISTQKLKKISRKNNWPKNKVLCLKVDISKAKEVLKKFSYAEKKFGKIYGLVNNAGVSIFTNWKNRTEKEIDHVAKTNLKGTINCINQFLKQSIKNKIEGSIVNVASHYGVISPDPRIYSELKRRNSEIYGATKAGIIQLTKYFAANGFVDGAKVRVNTVSPGGIESNLNLKSKNFIKSYKYRCPINRLASTEEVAKPILFLLSDESSYINGHNLIIDGGMSIW